MAWWWLLVPLGLAVAWWTLADASGYTKGKLTEREAKRQADRLERRREQLRRTDKGPDTRTHTRR
jgi:small Trp-rich protein